MPKPANACASADDRSCRTAGAPPHGPDTSPECRRRRGWRLAGALLLVIGGGCASAPVVRWHSLLAAADEPAAPVGNAVAAAAGAAPGLVVLTVVRVPVAADQQQWLVRLPDDTLRLLEEERWTAPLRDELRAALVQGLVARWGAVDAGGRPFEPTTDAIRDALPAMAGTPASSPTRPARQARPAATAAGAAGDAAVPAVPEPRRVTVDVTRFESLPDREARLEAGWTIAAPAAAGEPPAPLLACRSAFREPVGSGAPALAAGHRRAAAALADAIGRALQGGRTAVCPATGTLSG